DTAYLTGRIADPDPLDTFILDVDWGDGSPPETFTFRPGAPRDVRLGHPYRDDGTYTIRLAWRDQHGLGNSDVLTITVKNVAPSVFAGPDVVLFAGQPLNLNGYFTDPGRDSWTATVDYGDRSGIQPLDLRPNQSFHLRHRYEQPSTYTVTVTVRD